MRSIALAVCAFLFCGCASMQSNSNGPMNEACPFSGKPVNAEAVATHGGEQIGFCCKRCVSKFEAMSDAEKAETAAKIK